MLYRYILKPILFLFDPELVHDMFIRFGSCLGKFWVTRKLISIVYGYHGMDISRTVDGITYRTPILLAAGFDYNAKLIGILPHVGFGGEEIGSVTARPYDGNPKPRLIRLPKSKSIIVNKGLKNDGVDKIIERLKRQDARNESRNPSLSNVYSNFVVGVSIARTNDKKSAESIQAGIDDYLYSFKRLNEEGIGDYYTINISCPNAFGGESFAQPMLLEQLLMNIKKVPCSKPIYIKMPINLEWEKFDELLNIINKNGIQGVIIGNLNKNYSDLDLRTEAPEQYSGGLSGKPCAELSNQLIRKTREKYGKKFTIIGVGGIMSPKDAQDKFEAGADLIQLITGMIYEGPGLMKRIGMGLGRMS